MTRSVLCVLSATICLVLMQRAHADHYAGVEGFYSSDADGTDIAKTGLDFDFHRIDSEHYQGLSLEQARFRPFGQSWVEDHRAYFRFADSGSQWKWNGRIGSDGHTVLGNASIHNELPRRQEYFIEHEIVETPLGLQRRLYSTYFGAAYDLPFDQRNILTTVLGVQDFSGHNRRLQYRGSLVHVLAPEWGLSARLRLRYFHDSTPGEFDYFSPRWYAEAIPTLQLRRFNRGWRYEIAAGVGRQRTSDSDWHSARFAEASVTSPTDGHAWYFQAGFTYSNTPVNSSFTYDYEQLTLSFGRSF